MSFEFIDEFDRAVGPSASTCHSSPSLRTTQKMGFRDIMLNHAQRLTRCRSQRSNGLLIMRCRPRPGGIVTTAACINTLALGRWLLRGGYRVAHLSEPFEHEQCRSGRSARLARG